MDIAISILAVVAGIIGILGSILPGLPGPPLSWVGMLVLYLWGSGTNGAGEPMSLTELLISFVIMVVVSIVDYLIPMYFTKVTGGSKYAGRGAMIGLIVGIFLTPIGMIMGSFLGAFIGEWLYGKQEPPKALKAAIGSLLGIGAGIGIKTITACFIMTQILIYLK